MKKKGGISYVRAEIDVESINKEAKTFELVFATETPILRNYWWADEPFYEVLVCDRSAMVCDRLDAGLVALLDTHNNYSITNQYGIQRSWNIKAKECRATIEYTRQTTKADIWPDIENKIIRNVSVGPRILEYTRIPDAKDPIKGIPTYRATKWEVLEISLCPVQVDSASNVRSEGFDYQRAEGLKEYEIEIVNYNLNRSVMTPEQIEAQRQADLKADRQRGLDIRLAVRTANLDEVFADDLVQRGLSLDEARAEIAVKSAAPKPLTQEDINRAVEAERTRVSEIRTLVRTHKLGDEFADELATRKVKDKFLTLDEARAEILNKMAEGDKGPANNGNRGASAKGDERTHIIEAMVEGMMHRAMPGSVERFYKLKPQQGDKYEVGRAMDVKAHDYKHMSFIDLSRAILIANGVNGVSSMSKDEVAKRALDTTDLPDLFTSTVKRFMRMDYEAVVPEWMRFSREVPADDFRVKTGIKFDAEVTFEELAEDGEYKESNMMSNEKATIQLKTFARSFGITRKTIINDDQGVLTKIPKFIGLGAAQFQSKNAWANITGNVLCPDGNALFCAKHGNYGTGGAASVINDAALDAASTAMARQKSPESNELDITPAFLLCPPELINTAKKFLKGINPTMVKDVNLWDFLEPMKNVYFADKKAWYLVANPESTTVDGMVHAYLSGQEGLFTESYVDKKTDKIVIKSRLDFATSMWGWQGWYKNDGAAPVII